MVLTNRKKKFVSFVKFDKIRVKSVVKNVFSTLNSHKLLFFPKNTDLSRKFSGGGQNVCRSVQHLNYC